MKQGIVWMLALTATVTSRPAAQQQQAAFAKARAACLEGKGYTVK